MRLLVIAPALPFPTRTGAAVRNWALLSRLGRTARVTLLAFDTVAGPVAAPLKRAIDRLVTVPASRAGTVRRCRTLVAGRPDLLERYRAPGMAAALDDLLRRHPPDAVLVEGLEMTRWLPRLLRPDRAWAVIYDAHNVEWRLQARAAALDRTLRSRWPRALYSAIQASRLRSHEAHVCRGVDAVTCVSDVDRRALRELVPGVEPVVVPNGVEAGAPAGPPPAGSRDVLFVGTMDYRPNADAAAWLADDVFPRVRSAVPEARLVLVGRHPPRRLRGRERPDRIVVTGEVADARARVAQAAVCVAPLRIGSGTRLKILEALACGRAVVATPAAIEGLDLEDDRDLVIADQAGAFAAAVARLLTDRGEASRLGRHGRDTVARRYGWDEAADRLRETVARAVGARRDPAAADGQA